MPIDGSLATTRSISGSVIVALILRLLDVLIHLVLSFTQQMNEDKTRQS